MLLPKQELEQSAVPDAEVTSYFANHPSPPREGSIVEGVRKVMRAVEEAQGALPIPSGLTQIYHDIPMRDGFSSNLKIIRPTDNAPPGPAIVLCFGGGFIAGSNEQLTKTAQHLATLYGATVVSISYRLAPEFKFPYAQHDAIDSVKWVAAHASEPLLRADLTKGFILGGVSAGGALTGCLTRYFQAEPLPHPLTGQWLGMASLIGADNVPEQYQSYYLALEHNRNAPLLNAESIRSFKTLTEAPNTHPLRYAICSKSPVSGQPRSYFQVDGLDPLRDDGLIYHEILEKAGVETKIDFYPGCPHVHFASLPGTKLAQDGNIDTLMGFGWLLNLPIDRQRAAKVLADEPMANISRPY